MTLGTGPLPAIPPDEGPGWADLRDQSAALLKRADALLDGYSQAALEVQAGVCSPDLARRVSMLAASFREYRAQAELLGGELGRLTYEDRLAAGDRRLEVAEAFEAGRASAGTPARHRAPRQDRVPWLRLAGGGLAAALAALRIAWKHKLVTGAALAAVSVPVVTAGQMHVIPDITSVIAPPAAHAGRADVSPVTAWPVPSPSASSWPGRGKAPGAAVLSRKSRRADPDPTTPPRPPAASPAAPASPPSLAILTTAPVTLEADPGEQVEDGDIWLQAAGGDIAWSLQAFNCAVTPAGGQYAGTLPAGQIYDLELSLPAGALPGTCLVIISSPGQPDQQVTVTWGAG